MTPLLDQLLDAGLLQFGMFVSNGKSVPIQFHLDMLASYPDVLEAVATALRPQLPIVERLLCTVDALPLGVALALKLSVPLVYSKGSDGEMVHDLVGAYDIGHPTLLVTNVIGANNYSRLLADAKRVGLSVTHIAGIIELGVPSVLPKISFLKLYDTVELLGEQGRLPTGQVNAVKAWLAALADE